MINEDKIIESKKSLVTLNENKSKEIYKIAVNENIRKRKLLKINMTIYTPLLLILVLVLSLVIYNNRMTDHIESSDWNNIQYVSDKEYNLTSAIIEADDTNYIGSENIPDVETEFTINDVNTINITNNITNDYWSTNNKDLVKEILSLINLTYKQLKVESLEYEQIKKIFNSGYSLSLAVKNKYTICFTILENGDVILFDNYYFVSQTKIKYESFLNILTTVKNNNDEYVSDQPSYNLGDIQLTDEDTINNISGYLELDFNDYSTNNRQYYKNYKVKVNFYYSNQLLISNSINGSLFIPNTNIRFKSPADYYKFLCEQYDFYQFENVTGDTTNTVSFDIGDLTKEKEQWILQLSHANEVSQIKIEDNHYYEKITPENYLVTSGSIKNDLNYLIITSYDRLITNNVEREFSVFDTTVLNKYNEDFFQNKFLYVYETSVPSVIGKDYQGDLTQNGKEINFIHRCTSPIYGSSTTKIIIFLEIEIIDGVVNEEYLINGESMIPKEVILTINYNNEKKNITYRKGDTVYLREINNEYPYDRIVGLCFDETYINIFDSFVIEDDIEIFLLVDKNDTYFNTGIERIDLFVINVDDSSKNKYVLFNKYENMSIEVLEEKLGYYIDKAYSNSSLTNEFNFNYTIGRQNIVWVTESIESYKNVTTYNRKLETSTFSENGSEFGVKDATSAYLKYSFTTPEIYYGVDSIYSKYYKVSNEKLNRYNFEEETLFIYINRYAFDETCLLADYELKNITIENEKAVISLQRTYPIFAQVTKETYRCFDFICIDNLGEMYNILKNKQIDIAVDDAYFKEDWYANIELNDIEVIEFDKDVIYQTFAYYQYLEWYDITKIYEENENSFVIQNNNFKQVLDDFVNIGLIDYELTDKEIINQIYGENFDYNNYSLLLINRYSGYKNQHVGSIRVDMYITGSNIRTFKILSRIKEKSDFFDGNDFVKTHYVEIVAVPNEIIEKFNTSLNQKFEYVLASPAEGVRTLTFTKDGNIYGVNNLIYSYKSNYKLNDNETFTLLKFNTNDKTINYRNRIIRLLGYIPNDLNHFSSSNPWLYIERTAYKSNEVKCKYDFVSYDPKTKTLTLSRTFDNSIIDENFEPVVCYDIVEVVGLTLSYSDSYEINNDDFKLVIIDK